MVVFKGLISGVSRVRGSVCALSLSFIVATMWLSVPPTYAVPGCCVCFNCDTEPDFCTDQMATPPDCVTLCAGVGCPASTFSTVDTCATGCGSFAPFPTPTPTFTPTPTITLTPSLTPTPEDTFTPAPTPTPVYCCQGRTPDRCGISVPSNEENCEADETPVVDAACLAGSCQVFTPTFTRTNTRPPASTPTPTFTRTQTLTPTPTAELKFTVDPYACYRVKADQASASKGQDVPVDDVLLPPKMTTINKPFFACAPASVGASGPPKNPGEFLTCYKGKDDPKSDGPQGSVRNLLDMAGLDVDLGKGQLICMPSFGSFAAPPPAPTATVSGPTATPGSAPTNTP